MIKDTCLLQFQPVDADAMAKMLPYLRQHTGRSCDFSYGGILMWVDMFDYHYAIHNDTLFIMGRAPGTGEFTEPVTTFSVPLGVMPLEESVKVLRQYCESCNIDLIFSAVPQEDAERLMAIGSKEMTELPSWEDYIYDAQALATLAGKKMSKKRNHVNQFKATYPDGHFRFMKPEDVASVRNVISRNVDKEASQSREACYERKLADILLERIEEGDENLIGGLLCIGEQLAAYTIGDIIGDTLHIHVEKAERSVAGSFEAINKFFAEAVTALHPEIKFINREDDAGDPGLRLAKQSYHPLYLLKKYNIKF